MRVFEHIESKVSGCFLWLRKARKSYFYMSQTLHVLNFYCAYLTPGTTPMLANMPHMECLVISKPSFNLQKHGSSLSCLLTNWTMPHWSGDISTGKNLVWEGITVQGSFMESHQPELASNLPSV